MEIDLTKNFSKIFDAIGQTGVGRTQFAKGIGFKTTAQLGNTLKGEAMLSTKAIIEMIKTYKINPVFLFFGQGDMFLTGESSIEKLQREKQELTQKHNEALKTIMELNEVIKKLEKRNADLIDITSAAIKYHKEHSEISNNVESGLTEPVARLLKQFLTLSDDEDINAKAEELKSSLKKEKSK